MAVWRSFFGIASAAPRQRAMRAKPSSGSKSFIMASRFSGTIAFRAPVGPQQNAGVLDLECVLAHGPPLGHSTAFVLTNADDFQNCESYLVCAPGGSTSFYSLNCERGDVIRSLEPLVLNEARKGTL